MADSDIYRFTQLVRSQYPCIWIPTHEEAYALSIVRETALNLGRSLKQWASVGGVRDGLVAGTPPIPETEHPAAALYYLEKLTDQSIVVFQDITCWLSDDKTLRLLRNLINTCEKSGLQLILIDHQSHLPAVIDDYSVRFKPSLPDEDELESIVKDTLRKQVNQRKIEIDIKRRDLNTIIRNLRGLTRRQARQIIIDCVANDNKFDEEDINLVLARKRKLIQKDGLLEYIESPVDLSMIGGLARLKDWLAKRAGTLSNQEKEFGLSIPRGVLMLGVQGAGKSLCAKAIATAWQRPLLRMDVGALYDRYVGESERRLRDALSQAEMMAPIVLWIDEIEKAFASAASQSTDGGLSRRMFGSLLTWMQEHRTPVFLVATANDIEALPPELLRKGRFDEIFFVDLPDEEVRAQIFSIHLKMRKRDPLQYDLDAMAKASDGFSGAEIEAAIVSALQETYASKKKLTTEQILAAVRTSPPLSVTMAERVDALRAWAKGRCVPAN